MARVIPLQAPPVNRGRTGLGTRQRRVVLGLCLAILAVFLGQGPVRAEQAELDAEQLYRAVAGSVHLVAAVASLEDIKNKRNINQGSAVAISDRELITNCHVVKDKALVFLLRHGQARPAAVGRGDTDSDLCTLTVNGTSLAPVAQVRPFASLVVGERVYTIGSPKGLENTLGDGLVAGLRKRGKLRLVQITAPISQGSSGGGVFDRFGNLVGVTSFFLNEAQAINFAISIDDYAAIASLPPAAAGMAAVVPPAGGGVAAVAPVGLPPAPAPVPNVTPGRAGFNLELTVARSDKEAQETWSFLSTRYGDLLDGLQPRTQRFELPNRGTFYRLLAGTVSDRGRATGLCRELIQRGHASCVVR